jgi:hypothetical protein
LKGLAQGKHIEVVAWLLLSISYRIATEAVNNDFWLLQLLRIGHS